MVGVIVHTSGLAQYETPEAFRRLHGPCRAIVENILHERAEAQATERVLSDQVAAYGQKRNALATEKQSLMVRTFPEPLLATDPRIVRIVQEIEICVEGMTRLRPRLDQFSATVSNSNFLLSKLEDYFRSLKGVVDLPLCNTALPAWQPLKAETILDAIEARRRRLRELVSNIAGYRAAPFHSSVILKKEIESIEIDAARGAPDAFDAIETGKPVQWPVQVVETMLYGGKIEITVPDTMAILSHLFRDQMIAAAKAAIAAQADDAAALSDTERARLIGEAERDALAVQREEVALIREARAARLLVDYRPDTDPRALLGLSDELPPPSRH